MELVLHPDAAGAIERVQRPGFYIVSGRAGIGKKTAILQSLPSTAVSVVALENEKLSITIDQIRQATKQFHLRSGASHEYLVIDDAHLLSQEAQNSILKTLEELPSHITVIMITHQPHLLLPTVRSRGFQVYIPSPPADQVRYWIEQSGFTQNQLSVLMEMSDNRPALLAEYVRDESLRRAWDERRQEFERLGKGTLCQRLLAASRLQPQMPDVLEQLIQFSRIRLRRDGGEWADVVMSAEYAQRLAAANCNKKFILDVVAMRSMQ